MKIIARAHILAGALTAAASLAGKKKLFPLLEAVRLDVAPDGVVTVTGNVSDFSLRTTLPPIIAPTAGSIALPGGRLAGLVSAFPPEQDVEIATDGRVGVVACGRSKYRLPCIPIADLPGPLTLDQEIGRTVLAHDDAVRLFTAPAFAMSNEETRYYLRSELLHNEDGALAAVATDGSRLAKLVVPHAGGLSSDYSLIVPNCAVWVIAKLIANHDTVTLSRSTTLLQIEAGPHVLMAKLVDGTYPDYQRVIPPPSHDFIIVDPHELAPALARIKAVKVDDKLALPVGLWWDSAIPELHVTVAGMTELADDVVGVSEISGTGRIALKLDFLREQVDEFLDKRIRFDAGVGASAAVLRISAPNNPNYVGMIASMRWPAERMAEPVDNQVEPVKKRRKKA